MEDQQIFYVHGATWRKVKVLQRYTNKVFVLPWPYIQEGRFATLTAILHQAQSTLFA